MPQIKKKGTSGNARDYITRSQAIRKLQISLPDFRRLCIFKGIYPREPRSKKRASKSSTPSTTFYYTKDIQYLLHEPLVNKFRDQKALARKISKALGRNEVGDAARLERNLTPRMKLDHIIKERYPTFVDALRDLDDALSMLFLFASLPGTGSVPPKIIAKCQRLTMEFEHYLIRTHGLRKSFLSIKGIYYQATIQGQDILWLIPYKFVQRKAGDVDFRIMATFVEFYTTLLGFVNYRLYTSIGLVYPPKFDLKRDEDGAELSAFQLERTNGLGVHEAENSTEVKSNEKAQAEADKLLIFSANSENNSSADLSNGHAEEHNDKGGASTALDQFASFDPSADILLQPSRTADALTAAELFEPFTFYLSRETPRHPLEFMLKAFGCKRVGWDSVTGEAGSYCAESDTRITHQVVDRPDLPLFPAPVSDEEDVDVDSKTASVAVRNVNQRVPGRIYIQPQWVWDSVNAGRLQRVDLYAPGATLPPHLSPWIKSKKGEYDPTLPLAEQETAAEAEDREFEDSNDEEEEDVVITERSDDEGINITRGDVQAGRLEQELEKDFSDNDLDGGMNVKLADSADEDSEHDEKESKAEDDEFSGFSDDDHEDAAYDPVRGHQAELEAEARGHPLKPASAADQKRATKKAVLMSRSKAEREAAENLGRQKMMMSRRKRKMFEKMTYSNAKKDDEAERLRAKRRKLEKEKAKAKG